MNTNQPSSLFGGPHNEVMRHVERNALSSPGSMPADHLALLARIASNLTQMGHISVAIPPLPPTGKK
jgi:hypothetical protein